MTEEGVQLWAPGAACRGHLARPSRPGALGREPRTQLRNDQHPLATGARLTSHDDRVVTLAWAVTMFTAPLNGIRVFRWLTLCDLMLAVAVAATAFSPRFSLRHLRTRDKSGVLAGLALITLGGLIGSAFAADPAVSLLGTVGFFLTTAGVVGALLLWAPSRTHVRWFCGLWLAGAVVSALWAMLGGPTVAGRRLGLASHPNSLGLVCALGIGVAAAFVLAGPRMLRCLAGASCLVLVGGMLASGSRAALLGVVSAVLAVAVLSSRRQVVVCSAAAAAVVGGVVLLGVVQTAGLDDVGRLAGDRSTVESDAQRLGQLGHSLERIKDRPLTGDGFQSARETHSIYLQVLVAAGPLGLIGLVGASGSLLVAARREITAEGAAVTGDHALLAGLAGGYVGYLIGAAFQNTLSERYVWLYVAGALALAGGLRNDRLPGGTRRDQGSRHSTKSAVREREMA